MSAEKRQRLNEDVAEEDDVVTIRIPKAHLAAFRANKEEATGTVANWIFSDGFFCKSSLIHPSGSLNLDCSSRIYTDTNYIVRFVALE